VGAKATALELAETTERSEVHPSRSAGRRRYEAASTALIFVIRSSA
jgi:hypothetical protein